LHGTETTIMLVESLDGGPWTAGGRATVRGLEQSPYFGSTGQFGSNHSNGANVVMADASVRFFTPSMSPQVIEAMAALAGDKNVARFDD
jgi:prepilin-type processing-associated H-X9-DG protein